MKTDERIKFSPKFPPSKEQEVIFKAFKYGPESIQVEAVAGSGKSTTIKWMMTLDATPGAMLAFNKSIVNDIRPECPDYITVETAHAFGNKAMWSKFGRMSVSANKSKILLKEMNPKLFDPDLHEGQRKFSTIQRLYDTSNLISKMKIHLCDEHDEEKIKGIADRYGIEIEDSIVMMMPEIFKLILSKTNFIDFDDMMWMPIRLDLDIKSFEMLYVDECQDLNDLMLEYVNRMACGRVVSVGDRRQAIYGFAGSNHESMDKIRDKFGSIELPLNVCYRCDKNIIEKAKEIVPNIEAFHLNGDGEASIVETIDYDMPDGSMILSRRNANLVKPCLELLKVGRRANIKGRNIGEQIKTYVAKLKAKSIDELVELVEMTSQEKIEKLLAKDKIDMNAIEMTRDNADVVIALSESCNSVDQLKTKLDYLFSEESTGITLSSIHRSKGLEADQVTIIDYGRVRLSNDKMNEQDREQEKNLQYVGITRAKHKLNFKY